MLILNGNLVKTVVSEVHRTTRDQREEIVGNVISLRSTRHSPDHIGVDYNQESLAPLRTAPLRGKDLANNQEEGTLWTIDQPL